MLGDGGFYVQSPFPGDVDAARWLSDLVRSFFPPLVRWHVNPALGDHLNGLPPLLPRDFLGHLERKKEDPPLPVMCLCYAGVKNCLHIANMLHRKRNLIDFDDSVHLPAKVNYT